MKDLVSDNNFWASLVAQLVKSNLGSIPGLGRSLGEDNGYPLYYSGLENCMDCIIHGVAKSRIWLSDFHLLNNFYYTWWYVKILHLGSLAMCDSNGQFEFWKHFYWCNWGILTGRNKMLNAGLQTFAKLEKKITDSSYFLVIELIQ